MIGITSTAGTVRQYFLQVDRAMGDAVDAGIEQALEDLLDRMRPETPVLTGNMKAGYYIEPWGGGRFDLMDRMLYAERVIDLPRHQVLRALLDDLGPFLVEDVDRAISARLARLEATV